MRYCKATVFFIFLMVFLHLNVLSFAQQYGLRFSGAEVPQFQRTSLDINPDKYFSLRNEFTLSFQLSFPPGLVRYYGYILRIIDDQGNNVDLIFNYRSIASTSVNVIYGNEQTNILLETNIASMFDAWKEIKLTFDLRNHMMAFSIGDTTINAEGIYLSHRVKFLFGRNNHEHFKTVDVPPMKIRDVKVSKREKLIHHWPLNESMGDTPVDVIGNKEANVSNPTWLSRLYQNWENVFNDTIVGQAAVTYNKQEGKIYLVGQERLTVYTAADKKSEMIGFQAFPVGFFQGRQAFYDDLRNRVVLSNIWNSSFFAFNFSTKQWDTIYPGSNRVAVYWHYNKYFSAKDNSLLVFGGYGQYEFRNIVQQFLFSGNQNDTLRITGDTYYPRYLAALGFMHDTILLLGGHGSLSGKQIESPREFFDLTTYSIKDKKFSKRYDFIPPIKDAVFANSMVIDQNSKAFYALVFPYFEHYGYLQLVKGALYEPTFDIVGDRIPFQFEDISSFADLYYCPTINKLIAVSLFYNKEQNSTKASIYTISFPPDTLMEENGRKPAALHWIIYPGILGLLMIPIVFIWYFRRKSKRKKICKKEEETKPETTESHKVPIVSEELLQKNTVLFFGGFKIFNHSSVDITSKFSPLLKEIFILIWLNSLNGRNGVSSEKLKELFWFHKDEKKAMNNRAVNIAKLKCLLEEIDTCELSKQTGYWKIIFDENEVYNDYLACLLLANQKKTLQKNDILGLINIIDKGAFLEDLSYEWLDAFKAEISNIIIDIFVDFGLSFDVNVDPDFILNLADTIFYFDIVNEEAMILKCKSLNAKGKHSMANKSYLEFVKNYKALYDSDFEKSFSEIIK